MTVRLLADHETAKVEASAQICVVGAGIAGLFAATRLAKNGYSVGVLESGLRTYDPEIDGLNEVDDRYGRYRGAREGRCRGLGGTSPRWGGRILPMTAHDTRARPYASIIEWPFDASELDVYRPEIERTFGIDHESFEEDLLNRLDSHGVFRRSDPDFALRFPKWPSFRRCNLNNVLRDQIEGLSNLNIWLGATVCEFEIDPNNQRLISLTARNFAGRTIRVQANEFVFTTGTIEATRLLLCLDAASQGRVFETCHVLGRYFQDHLTCSVGNLAVRERDTANLWFGYYFIGATRRNLHMELTPTAQQADDVPSAFAQVYIEPSADSALNIIKNFLRGLQKGQIDMSLHDGLRLAADAGFLLQMAYWRYVRGQLFLPPDLRLTLNICAEQVPNRDNRILLSDRKDRLGMPLARLEWQPGAHDERTLRACIARLRSYCSGVGSIRFVPLNGHRPPWMNKARSWNKPPTCIIPRARREWEPIQRNQSLIKTFAVIILRT
jgi:choline dehydrogenase-like flavoprotein